MLKGQLKAFPTYIGKHLREQSRTQIKSTIIQMKSTTQMQ